MSSINVLDCLPSDHFHCIICTKIFTDPVTTPCRHSFCKSCLNHQWDQSEFCQCPVCKKRFAVRPEIGTNSVMEELEDGIFVCVLCLQTDHKDHQVVSMEEEGAQQKENMGSLMRQIELMIEERMDKVKTFTNSSVMRKATAQK
uniref:RING-type domain-containing protein n=1 Tax=Knipowitschia caucasica TaxID=637954 RepID=A0AAV2KSQ5_KNICA